MNRLKLWLFALLVVAAGAITLRVVVAQQREDALEAVDARVLAAGARAAVQHSVLATEVAGVAVAAARDPRLAESLREAPPPAPPAPAPKKGKAAAEPAPAPPPDPAALEQARSDALAGAVSAAQAALGVQLSGEARRLAATRATLARLEAASPAGDKEPLDLLAAATDGQHRRGVVRSGGRAWMAAAAPAGEGAGLVVLAPLDAGWAQAAVAGSGADLAVAVPEAKLVATGSAAEADAAVRAALAAPGTPANSGRLGAARVRVLGLPMPETSLLFGAPAPARRALALPIPGLRGGYWVLSAPTAPELLPVLELQWEGIAALGALLVLGFLFGLLVHPTEVAARLPSGLVQAADRIARGEFQARAPQLAGQLGTVADALNRAAAAVEAQAGQALSSNSITQEFFAGKGPETGAPAEPEGDPFQFAPRKPVAPAAAPGLGLGGGAFEAAPVPAAPEPPAPKPPRPGSTGTAPAFPSAPAFPAAAPPAPPPAGPFDEAGEAGEGTPEETEWRQVFRAFLDTRERCGEPSEGLTWEKFRQKLEANQAALVAKYACKSVRFQVYVKEGKAALKATPVR